MNIKYTKFILGTALLLSGVFSVVAQTPGGVTNPNYIWAAWLTPESYSAGTWTNLINTNGTVGNFSGATTAPTVNNTEGYNYNPAVVFAKSGNASAPNQIYSQNSMNIKPTENVTSIFVFQRKKDTNWDYLMGIANSTNYNLLGWRTSNSQNLTLLWGGNGASDNLGALQRGILIVDNPNINDGVSNKTLTAYRNGAQTTARAYQWNGSTNAGNGTVAIGGGRNNTDYYGFHGNMMEVILLKKTGNGNIASSDIQKIQSYLAVKYGLPLSNNYDYLNSNGNAVWSRSTNNGYNNSIFGLARDDNSRLNVKQATFNDPNAALGTAGSAIIAYIGTLAQFNTQNAATFTNDKTFVLFGSNGQSGVTNYEYSTTLYPTFANGGAVTGTINYRYKTTFKAQVSGESQVTLNIKTTNYDPYIASANVLFVSSDPNFNQSVTRAYKIDNTGVAANVQINNGDYLMFSTLIEQQQPNYTRTVWLKAGDLGQGDGDPVATSSSASWGGFYQTNSNRQPRMNKSSDLMNFHPSVKFNGSYNLNTGANGTLSASKSYYVFYVSQFDGTKATDQNVVYAMNGTGNYNAWYQRNPSFTTNNSTQQQFVQSGTIKNYGITGVIRPNVNNLMQYIYFNGSWQFKPAATVSLANNQNAFIGGSSNAVTPANAFIGNLQELIVVESNSTGQMDFAEAQKINSYLAFKYGLTLEIGDYIDNNGDVFWSRTKAVDNNGVKYENTIFGLGRNYAMGVHQKQARGYNKPNNAPFAVYMGGAPLADLNQTNPSVLTDNTFLMFSADQSIRSFRALQTPIPSSVVYRNNESFSREINYTSAVFQVQAKNWPAGTLGEVNFKNMTKSTLCYLLVSQDPLFGANDTDLYPFDNSTQVLNNPIEIKDGDYVCMMTWGDPAPGGVFEDLRMWMNPVASTLTMSGGKISQWNDFSSNGTVFSQSQPNQQPPYSTDDPRMNYHPAVMFNDKIKSTGALNSGNSKGKEFFTSPTGIMSVASPAHYVFFTVFNTDFQYNDNDRHAYAMGWGSQNPEDNNNNRHPAIGLAGATDGTSAGRYREQTTAEIDGSKNLFKQKATNIMFDEVIKGQKIRFEFNANGEDKASNSIGNSTRMAKGGTYGSTLGGGSYTERFLHGPLSEVFAYERELDQQEKDAIYSYLGLKYGITIDPDVTNEEINFDYLLSDNNTIIWPGNSSEKHQKYHYNVAALVRDDLSALNNARSHSTGEGSIVFMGIGTDNNWTGFENDKSALVWGHDATTMEGSGSEIEFDVNDAVCSDVDRRLRRIWLVDNSAWKLSDPNDYTSKVQASQKVVIRLDPNNFYYPAGLQYQVFLLVADSEEDLYGGSVSPYSDAVHNWKKAIPSVIVDDPNIPNGKLFQFEYTFENKYTYFTFGIKDLGGGCEGCGFSGNKVLNFVRNTTWVNRSLSSVPNIDLGNGFSAKVNVSASGGAVLRSSSPRAYTGKSLYIRRSGNSNGAVRTVIKPVMLSDQNISVPATATFEIQSVGRAGTNRNDQVEIIGMCNGKNVYPKLSYVIAEKKSSYRISRNVATGLTRPNTSYTSTVGKMLVEFRFPVDSVIINYKLVGRTVASGATGEIGIGPVTFSCPPVMPPVNEAMLSFIKEAPTTKDLCSKVDYIYRIYNANCSPKEVYFEDVLPEGMIWDRFDFGDEDESLVTNDYKGKRELIVENLLIPGGTTLAFKATAIFANNATPKNYGSQASISYKYLVSNIDTPETLYSWDRFNGEGQPSITEATGSIANKIPEITYKFTTNRTSYSLGSTITYTLKIDNNASVPLSDVELTLQFPEEFTLDLPPTGDLTLGVPDSENGDGWYYYTGMTLGANTSYTLTFKLKAPDTVGTLPLVYDPDTDLPLMVDGKNVIGDLATEFILSTDSPDACITSAFDNSSGTVSIPFTYGKEAIISNTNVTSKIIR